MNYFTERNGLRSSTVQKSYNIDIDQYGIIFDCCEKYFENLSWKYPAKCRDNRDEIIGLNRDNLITLFRSGEIPDLFDVQNGSLRKPDKYNQFYENISEIYDQNALLDLIEFLAKNIKDVERLDFHSYCGYNHLRLLETQDVFYDFQKEINKTFEELRLLYHLNDKREVERLLPDGCPITTEVEAVLMSAPERGNLRKHLSEAIRLYHSRKEEDISLAKNQLWDALESLKTYYSPELGTEDRKKVIERLVNVITDYKRSDCKEGIDFKKFFDNEITFLTLIGNNYNIRHTGTTEPTLPDPRYYDYFFNRCVSLIALAIPYLEQETNVVHVQE